MEPQYLTKEKHDALVSELETLITVRRPEIAKQLEYARSLGDLSENAEYHEARQLQGEIESRIKYLAVLLKSVHIVTPHHSDSVEVGSSVTIEKSGGGDAKTFQIVGSEEANTAEGRISLNSPLGAAMMGKKKSENFTFTTPTGKKVEYVIKKID
jgi:transcription elongation factor GreA